MQARDHPTKDCHPSCSSALLARERSLVRLVERIELGRDQYSAADDAAVKQAKINVTCQALSNLREQLQQSSCRKSQPTIPENIDA